jgi:hypothetical protein
MGGRKLLTSWQPKSRELVSMVELLTRYTLQGMSPIDLLPPTRAHLGIHHSTVSYSMCESIDGLVPSSSVHFPKAHQLATKLLTHEPFLETLQIQTIIHLRMFSIQLLVPCSSLSSA